jgi:hypothetical protein
MSKDIIIKKYNEELVTLARNVTSLEGLEDDKLSEISQLKSPAARLDEQVSVLTVKINTKIEQLSIVSTAATNCGCGSTALVTYTPTTFPYTPYSVVETVGNLVYYDQVKAHRIAGEDVEYYGPNPLDSYPRTDGSVIFTSGIGTDTKIIDNDTNSILDIIILNPGGGFISSDFPYYSQKLSGGSGTGAIANITVSTGTTVITEAIITNGGRNYKVGDTLTTVGFAGASFGVSAVGAPTLGVGVDTLIESNSGVGSVFIPTIFPTNVSICSTSCLDYSNQISIINSELDSLRRQRDSLLPAAVTIKDELKRIYLQRWSYGFGKNETLNRKNNIDNLTSVLEDNQYDEYFT